ncbi:PfaD family polyunsaturated fatty acid/polyketide biosynthesis protein [Streptomyces sp. NPDC007883]|uniref:PfaD family polyunsaturated fatty acid/polyketide biosynthesis protein n=1 Tax=Streptomyces sp. NPDC007883 TaxID=3155116 RepID=UPI0033C5C935
MAVVHAEQALAAVAAVAPENLGSARFRADHGVRYAYVAGSMYKAVASEDMVVRMGRAGLLSYFGTGGLRPDRVIAAVRRFERELGEGPYGFNLLAGGDNPRKEEEQVGIFLRHGVRRVEAASFVRPTPAVVRYRLTGLRPARDGSVRVPNRVMAKVSRPEVARSFLEPAPPAMVGDLLARGLLTAEEADLAARVPMADDLVAEADSGGHTDQRPLVILLPDTVRQRDMAAREFPAAAGVRVGAAGGLGTPHAVAAAFVMGADFVLTGSINQCTAQCGTSETVKDMLQQADVHDMALVPAGDMLETGARAQVLRRGLFYPARANRLYELYRRHGSLEELDPATAEQLQRRYFRRSFDEVWEETRAYYRQADPDTLARAERDPKHRMLLVFKAYFVQSIRLAMSGSAEHQVDYQINCGPAMGALNGLLRGTEREDWRNRHVDELADLLMAGAAQLLSERMRAMARPDPVPASQYRRLP